MLKWHRICTGGLDPRDLKTALFCISFLRKGEVLAYVGRIHNLKDLMREKGRVGEMDSGECHRPAVGVCDQQEYPMLHSEQHRVHVCEE